MQRRCTLTYAASTLLLAGSLAVVAGCGSSSTSGSPSGPDMGGSASSANTSAGTGAVQRLSVSVTGSTVTPAPAQLELPAGGTLELTVTSDHDDELHAHGFEVEAPLKAGVPSTVRLTASEPGVYEVETHDPALTLLTVAVR